MARRFGRNRKRKLQQEISQLKYQLSVRPLVSPFERHLPDRINVQRYMSYGELYALYDDIDKHDMTVPHKVDITPFHRLKFRSEIQNSYSAINQRALLIQMAIDDKRMNYYIDTAYLKDLFKRGYPLEALYKEVYNSFIHEVEKALQDL